MNRLWNPLSCLLFYAVLAGFFIPSHALAQRARPLKASEQMVVIPTLWIEEMTSQEVQLAIRQGYTNIIIPTAGIKQNGQHLPLSKDKLVVRENAMVIAQRLGDTLIAPIIDFSPEGALESEQGHMAFAGTITIPRKLFADLLDNMVRSLHRHGFRQIYIIGGNSSSQQTQDLLAKALQRDKISAYQIHSYYMTDNLTEELRLLGFTREDIGGHAGLRDTSELLAVASHQVRRDRMTAVPEKDALKTGGWGDATKASSALGHHLLELRVNGAVKEICEVSKTPPPGCVMER